MASYEETVAAYRRMQEIADSNMPMMERVKAINEIEKQMGIQKPLGKKQERNLARQELTRQAGELEKIASGKGEQMPSAAQALLSQSLENTRRSALGLATGAQGTTGQGLAIREALRAGAQAESLAAGQAAGLRAQEQQAQLARQDAARRELINLQVTQLGLNKKQPSKGAQIAGAVLQAGTTLGAAYLGGPAGAQAGSQLGGAVNQAAGLAPSDVGGQQQALSAPSPQGGAQLSTPPPPVGANPIAGQQQALSSAQNMPSPQGTSQVQAISILSNGPGALALSRYRSNQPPQPGDDYYIQLAQYHGFI